ncbi:MAG: mechanosensitive ion channel family protein [Acidimicrobiia bacterium]
MPSVIENLIRTAIVVALSGVLYWLAIRVGHQFVRRASAKGGEHQERAETLWIVLRRVILIVLVVSVVFVLFDTWGFSITPFLALGTVVGAAVGFGAQDLIKDVIAGFFILVEDQFHVGDTVSIAGVTGTVEDIQLRVTVMRDYEGVVHFVPNGQISVSSNYTSHFSKPVIDVGVDYGTDVNRALEVFKDELDRLASDSEWGPKIIGEVEIFGVNALDDSAVVLRGRLTTVADERWAVRREALRRIKNRFDAEGITIPFPQITVHRADQ